MTETRLLDSTGTPVPAAAIRRVRMGANAVANASWGYGGVPAFSYDAADTMSQEMGGWWPSLRSPDAEINLDRDRMVARQRDLVRNDGWPTGSVQRILDNTIGWQFRLISKPHYMALRHASPAFDAVWAKEYAAAVNAWWSMYADDPGHYCDAARTLSMTQMFYLALRHKLIDGDALAVLLWLPEFVGQFGAQNATVVQLVDPDRLCNPMLAPDTRNLRAGVEIDDLGAPIAYHIRRGYPNDWYSAAESMTWDRVDRQTPWGRPVTVHDFDMQRVGQNRGISVLTPILARFKMLTKYDGAELQQAILQTIFGSFITSPFDAGQVQNALADPVDTELSTYQQMRNEFHAARSLMLGGVRIPTMAPGEDIKTVSPTRPGSTFNDFEHALLRNIAAALGLSAAQVSQDWSRANYSSARAELLDAWKTLTRRRADFAIGFATPIFCAWLEEQHDKGRLPMPANAMDVAPFHQWRAAYARCKWIGPGRGWIDPLKERQGEVLGLDAAFGTLEDSVAEIGGGDWIETIDQREAEIEEFRKRGMKLPQWAAESEAAPDPSREQRAA